MRLDEVPVALPPMPRSTLLGTPPAGSLAAVTAQFRQLQQHAKALEQHAAELATRATASVKLLRLMSRTLQAP